MVQLKIIKMGGRNILNEMCEIRENEKDKW